MKERRILKGPNIYPITHCVIALEPTALGQLEHEYTWINHGKTIEMGKHSSFWGNESWNRRKCPYERTEYPFTWTMTAVKGRNRKISLSLQTVLHAKELE
ncbi:hypothetical protein Tco_0529571 [Tanacetum coccineum]